MGVVPWCGGAVMWCKGVVLGCGACGDIYCDLMLCFDGVVVGSCGVVGVMQWYGAMW